MSETTLSLAAGGDDGYQASDNSVVLSSTSANCNSTQLIIGMIFREVPVEQGDTVLPSHLNVYCISSANDTPNLTIRAEINPADFAATSNSMGGRTKTAAGVVWNENLASSGAQYHETPDIAAVIQEIVDDPSWVAGGDIAIYFIDNGGSGLLRISMRDSGTTQEPELYLAWEAATGSELTYAWPSDYWPDAYWAEYWPDYGTETPPATIIPLVMHHLKQMEIA